MKKIKLYQSIDRLTISNESVDILPKPSDEQEEILINFKAGYNIKIEAVAGSGKTTTLLLLAKATNKKVLILTYNKDLRDEINQKLKKFGIHHCQVYTYHAYACKIYQTTINTDTLLRHYLTTQPTTIYDYDVLLLDEVQDMTIDYYHLVCKIINDNMNLVLVGDRRQCINDYIGATADYLINYPGYFKTSKPWKELMLRTSYRLTPSIANFVNKNILKQDLIIGGNVKSNDILPIYNYSTWHINDLIESLVNKYGTDQVVILKASTKSITEKSPLGKLIAHSRIKFCQRENEPLDDKVMKGKVLISSFNAFKGRQRKCVLVFGMDESYFEYYDKKWDDPNALPNIIYVAVTRASESLILIQDDKKSPFRTTNREIIKETCQVMGEQASKRKSYKEGKDYNVTDLINHRNTQDMIDMLNLIKITVIQKPSQVYHYEQLVAFGTYYEDMRSYYGTLIPMIADFKLNKHNHYIIYKNNKIKPEHVMEKYEKLKDKHTIKEWMEYVVILDAINSGHYFYVDQILDYDWVDENFVNITADRIINIIPSQGKFEFGLSYQNINGIIDYLSENDEIWEFKCTLTLKDEHYIQCATYIALYALIHDKILTGKVYNARTDELVEITLDNPKEFLEILIRHKM
jgi:hypothetical protein